MDFVAVFGAEIGGDEATRTRADDDDFFTQFRHH